MSASRLVRVLELIHQRRAHRERLRRSGPQRALAASALLLGAVSVLAATALLFAPQAYAYLTRDLPALEALPALFDAQDGALLQPTIFYAADGGELLRLESADYPRRFIDIQNAPLLASALVASRQPDYWTQPLFNTAPFDSPPGIAEELIEEFLYPQAEGSWLQTLRVRLLAAQLVERYGREQVLSWYVNSRVFGYYAVGVEAASQLYFGKAASQLTLAEATQLAPVAQAPALNPIDAPQLAVQRQQTLLLQMLDQDLIDEAAVTDALVQPLAIQPAPTAPASRAPEFTALAQAQLQDLVGFEAAVRGGLRVQTSFDTALKALLDAALATQPTGPGHAGTDRPPHPAGSCCSSPFHLFNSLRPQSVTCQPGLG
jgi:membrane peptidoglycan carboxypeptidase